MTPGLFTQLEELEHCVLYADVMRRKSISRLSYSITRCMAVFRTVDQSNHDCQSCQHERQLSKITHWLTVQSMNTSLYTAFIFKKPLSEALFKYKYHFKQHLLENSLKDFCYINSVHIPIFVFRIIFCSSKITFWCLINSGKISYQHTNICCCNICSVCFWIILNSCYQLYLFDLRLGFSFSVVWNVSYKPFIFSSSKCRGECTFYSFSSSCTSTSSWQLCPKFAC